MEAVKVVKDRYRHRVLWRFDCELSNALASECGLFGQICILSNRNGTRLGAELKGADVNENWRPKLNDKEILLGLVPREAPYFNILQYCRHLGVHVRPDGTGYWVARVRKRGGGYMQRRLMLAFEKHSIINNFSTAKAHAETWFSTKKVSALASEPYELGSRRTLSICPIGPDYSVGHALDAYLEWKSLAATKSHFETLVSLVNYHLVPRVAQIKLSEFNGASFHKLAKDVLETPPKYGRKTPLERVDIRLLSQSQLRKRKKTLNALVSILKGAFEIAWEHGHLENDRPIRCLKRLPNIDRPRVLFLDQVECERLLSACDDDLRKLVRAALFTGCRANELIKLTVGDFSASTRSVYVSSPKGHKTRHVLLPSVAVAFFCRMAEGKTANERLFRKDNGRLWGGEYKSYFQRARTKAKLPVEVTFHGLRHTYASRLLEGGVSIVTVADQLGHANTQTVSATYGHVRSAKKLDEIEACFTDGTAQSSSLSEESLQPVFRHYSESSWPRANHSRYSGTLLKELVPREIQ